MAAPVAWVVHGFAAPEAGSTPVGACPGHRRDGGEAVGRLLIGGAAVDARLPFTLADGGHRRGQVDRGQGGVGLAGEPLGEHRHEPSPLLPRRQVGLQRGQHLAGRPEALVAGAGQRPPQDPHQPQGSRLRRDRWGEGAGPACWATAGSTWAGGRRAPCRTAARAARCPPRRGLSRPVGRRPASCSGARWRRRSMTRPRIVSGSPSAGPTAKSSILVVPLLLSMRTQSGVRPPWTTGVLPAVGEGERVQQPAHDVHADRERDLPAAAHLQDDAQAGSVDVFHGDEGLRADPARLEHADHVGVIAERLPRAPRRR